MKYTWRTEWPLWILLAAMFLAAAVAWPTAPDRIPIHWDIHGDVNGYGGRFEGLLLIPVIALGIYLLFLILPKLDPLHRNYAQFAGAFTLFRFSILLFLAVIEGIIHLWMRGRTVPIPVLLPIMVGALFLVLGVVLGKLQPNWFMGIRTPWTLMSRRSWTKTHEAARWIFWIAGVTLIVGGFLASAKILIGTIVFLAVGILTLVVYSYLLWRDDPERVTPASSLHAD
jgi:uncharacterized membrane protein